MDAQAAAASHIGVYDDSKSFYVYFKLQGSVYCIIKMNEMQWLIIQN